MSWASVMTKPAKIDSRFPDSSIMEHGAWEAKATNCPLNTYLAPHQENTMSRLYDREKIPEQWNEFFECCQSDSLSEEGLRQIIERGGLTTHNLPSFHFGSYQFFLESCCNERVTDGIIRCLLEYFPAAASAIEDSGWSPLHCVCQNQNVTPNIIQLLIDAAPDSIRSVTSDGWMPLHRFCAEGALDGTAAIQMLKLLIEKYPAAVRYADTSGDLPIHIASQNKSPEFCRVLIDGYPGSERMNNVDGVLPLHYACLFNTVATVEYLYKLYPDAINHAATNGRYPIHYAIGSKSHRDNPTDAVNTVRYLLKCDTNVKFQKIRGTESLLHVACRVEYTDSNIHAGIQIIKAIYDAHPEAIEENSIASHIQRYREQVRTFINNELVYARQAKDHHHMTTPDSNDRLPLHTALQNNVTLGSIKLLVKGHPPAVQSPDNSGLIPLHIACQHHESPTSFSIWPDLIHRLSVLWMRRGTQLSILLVAVVATRSLHFYWINLMLYRYRNRMHRRSFPLIFFGRAVTSLIEKALNTRRASFGF